ncbi:MAG: adenine phosphoribosyltransferase [Ghiorsea sp.]
MLQAKNILLTRTAEQNQQTAPLLIEYGANPVFFPCFTLEHMMSEMEAGLQALAATPMQDVDVIFSSRNGVKAILAATEHHGASLSETLKGCRLVAVGQKTANLLQQHGCTVALIPQLACHMPDNIDAIVGIESRGFLFGAALAQLTGVGFVPIRKPGKLPAATHAIEYELEYGTDVLEIHKDALSAGHRVVVVDDLLATGGTAAATVQLIQKLGANVAACLFVIELDFLGGRKNLQDVPVHSLLKY